MFTEPTPLLSSAVDASPWDRLASDVLTGTPISADDALSLLTADDNQTLSILAAAYRLRHRYFGNTVQLYFLMNAKSGLCPEDCSYCSQSKVSEAEIPRYNLLNRAQLLDGARVAAERESKTYCIVISARGPSDREIQAIEQIVPEIKSTYGLKICVSLGLLTREDTQRLKACGVDRVNHNLNTSSTHYGTICSTHTYQDRLDTLRAVSDAGLEMCSGGILGMGEQPRDMVEMALELRKLGVQSVPVNFLNSIEGTPLEDRSELNPRYCLRALAMFRFAMPDREIRISGGREIHLRSLQPMGLYAANSMFVGDYLTTKGQPPEADYQMIEDLGFEITRNEEVGSAGKSLAM